MTSTGGGGLPEPEVLEQAALEMVALAPEGWDDLAMIVWYEAPDVYNTLMWVDGPGLERSRVKPPYCDGDLDDMRSRQIAAGQPAWLRCDLRVTREPGSDDPELTVDFAYEVGDVPV
jgi:hypothetical protein